MGFFEIYNKYSDFAFDEFFLTVKDSDIIKAFRNENPGVNQFLSLLSHGAEKHLEGMAGRAHESTVRYFGKTIQLYTPMYVSNFCENECIYCGFNKKRDIDRKRLTAEEIEKEAEFIARTGLKHILVLTGESRRESPIPYIKRCIEILKKYFSSISVEIYALTEEEYRELIDEGVDGLTIYQEAYDRSTYDRVHPEGPKRDFTFRLGAPERAARSRMRSVNIGALLGLGPWEREAFFTGLHAKYLQDNFPDVDVSVSMPRLRPYMRGTSPLYEVTDKNLAQIILATRIFLPRIGITLSTREKAELRENLMPLGITRMSADSSTAVGGHTIGVEDGAKPTQFEIRDCRDVKEIKGMLLKKGYQPVLKDWMRI
jgi:2-iminoacetate synthase